MRVAQATGSIEPASRKASAVQTSDDCHAAAAEAALSLRPSHQRILDAFMLHGAMTPDELAEKLVRSVFYTRPRCSELRTMGLLHPTGELRRNALSGLKAEVLAA